MHPKQHSLSSILDLDPPHAAQVARRMWCVVIFLSLGLIVQPGRAQTLQVLHNFTGGTDGGVPGVGVTLDSAGNVYGTNLTNNGTVFKLSRSGSAWMFKTLYTFQGGNDGWAPYAEVVIGREGALYGTTLGGGTGGTVFKVRPYSTVCVAAVCPWNETVLYRFTGGSDGMAPYGPVVFDRVGNLYGTTNVGGGTGCSGSGCGTVFELALMNGVWTESILHAFNGSDGASPARDTVLSFDGAGNIYGATLSGGAFDCGTVFQLSPTASGWTEHVLYSFQGASDGCGPAGGVVVDHSGTLYGSTTNGPGGGTVFSLSPSGGNWIFNLIYTFAGYSGPQASLTMNAAGNLYGTTTNGGVNCSYGSNGCGAVFKLTPTQGGWMYTSLHNFNGNDGAFPYSTVVFDAAGNLYGTAAYGGTYDKGVVWEIIP